MATIIENLTIKVDAKEATEALNNLTIAAIKAQEAIAKLGDICFTVANEN